MESDLDFDSEVIKNMIKEIKDIIKNSENEQKFYIEELRNKESIPSEFNPLTYKTHKCPLNLLCKLPVNQCLNYHDDKNDRRRPYQNYKAEFCENVMNKGKPIPNAICPYRDECQKCHFYHENSEKMESEIDFSDDNIISLISKIQDIYEKTSNEQKYINEEIRNEYFIPSEFNPITYKTHKCPLNLLCKLPVNQCLNYHDNKNDRRRPFQTYNAEFCENIFNLKTKKIIKGKTCPNNDDCKKCHNKFEIMYHPDQFRKHKCPLILKGKSCQNRLICPFTHDDEIEESFNETEIKNKTMIISNAKIVQNYYKKLMNDYYKAAKEYKNKLNDCYQLHKCPICHKHIMIKEKSYNICDNGLICCDECAKEKKEEEFINVKIKLDE
jgi:hypothetical protein